MQNNRYMITVHAGAHCCGADDFHRFLSANRRAVADKGFDLAYPGRNGAPGGTLDSALPEPRHAQGDLRPFAAKIAAALDPCRTVGARGLIVSDQDLPGRLVNLMGGRFYPAAHARARALRMALGQAVDRLVLVVQPYDALFLATWRRFALDRVIEPFSHYAPAMAESQGSWIDVVEHLRDGLEARRVTILAGAQHPASLLSHVAQGLHLPSHILPDPVPQPTDSAVAMIQRHYRQGASFARGQRDRILAFHARQPQGLPAQTFDSLPLADMRGRYVADLDTLSRMDGVEVFGGALPMLTAMAAE
jgi:hypothetical protein